MNHQELENFGKLDRRVGSLSARAEDLSEDLSAAPDNVGRAPLIGEVKELLVPATPQQIIQTLGVLQHAYPGFAGHSRIFDHFAVDDLVIMRPSLIALVGGCRWLRQNSPEAPSVAQLLAAVECCERFWLRGWNALEHGYAARVQALADGAQVPATPTLH